MTRVFALSDIHLDHDLNARWLAELSMQDYRDDILLLAGDVSDRSSILERCFADLAKRFHTVLYVPGNHDLWVLREPSFATSLDKYRFIRQLASDQGIGMKPLHRPEVSIVPLLGWYDYSFGAPSQKLRDAWMDYRACRWPGGLDEEGITRAFTSENELSFQAPGQVVISFSHFLPRIDVMPHFIPPEHRLVYPVLGSQVLEEQVRALRSQIHVYGHSHVNRQVTLDGVVYVNNALAYPTETRISARALKCVFEF